MNEWEWQLLEDHSAVESVTVAGVQIKRGDRVRLRPQAGGDIFDLALAGQVAIVDAIEQDYESQLQLAVVLDDDPGKDLGVLRQPGHRFFFKPEEVEPLSPGPRVLVAGIGNIFLGDDAFGVEVIRRLKNIPESVTVKDFGIRSYDLAYALLDGYDVVLLLDATARGGKPGTLYIIEPDVAGGPVPGCVDAHAMDPVSILKMAAGMGQISGRILVIGCEAATLGGEDGCMGLSAEVAAAADEAARLVEGLTAAILRGAKPDEWFSNFPAQ